MLAVGIDTGGTFTDAFVSDGDGRIATVKVETTPHDLTVCFADAIRASADALETPLDVFLRQAEIIRFSSTIGTNTVLTRSGPRLGLLVSPGGAGDLYGAASDGLLFGFVPRELVGVLEEETSTGGAIVRGPELDGLNAAVRGLLERGARLLVVSLRNAGVNPTNEQAVQRMIDASYPRHYLGAVPVLLSTQVSALADDALRTASAVVNAYMHQKLSSSLYKAEDDLRRGGFRRPLLVVNTDGGVTRVAKTRALATYQSGPTSGVHAAALLCAGADISNALTADVGGTSTDVGLVIDSRPVLRDRVDVGGLSVRQPSVELVSLGIGGGSLAQVIDGELRVGPESAGAAPGPACFALGGRRPTPTDAWLVLGILDPEYYLGGRKRLDRALARAALDEGIAQPLELSIEEAALALLEVAEISVAEGIERLLARPDVRAELGTPDLEELALVAYGGGGGLLMPAVARRLGLGTVILSRYSPVFSAFGVSTFDVRHRYEARGILAAPGGEDLLARLVADARRDMRGEGFPAESITFEVSVSDDVTGRPIGTSVPLDAVLSGDVRRDRPVLVELEATCTVDKPILKPECETDQVPVPKGEREITLPVGRQRVAVFGRDTLRAGNAISGPALVEATDTTYLVPADVTCRIDRAGSAVLTQGSR